jgi:type IX secretion system PorP/SprF family membrane protein
MKNIKMILFLLVVLFAGYADQIKAQQSSLYTMYMWNQLIINPAYAGSREAVSASLVSRHQWVGLDGAPSTQVLSIHSPLPNDNVGLGLTIENDRIGPTNNTGVWGDFAYRIRTGENTKLSFGLRAGFSIFQADLSNVENTEPNDPAFLRNVDNNFLPNFGLGVYYSGKKGYVGLASPTLLESEVNDFSISGANLRGVNERHYYLLGGYVFNLSSDSSGVMFKPATVIRLVNGAPVSFDVSANFLIQQKLWLGVAYRYLDSFAGIISFQFTEHLQAGYSYDFGTSRLNNYHNGSHEIMLSYDFFRKDIKTRSPRYF